MLIGLLLLCLLMLLLILHLVLRRMSLLVSLRSSRSLAWRHLPWLGRRLRNRGLGDSPLKVLDMLRRYRRLSRSGRWARLVVYLRGSDGAAVQLRGLLLRLHLLELLDVLMLRVLLLHHGGLHGGRGQGSLDGGRLGLAPDVTRLRKVSAVMLRLRLLLVLLVMLLLLLLRLLVLEMLESLLREAATLVHGTAQGGACASAKLLHLGRVLLLMLVMMLLLLLGLLLLILMMILLGLMLLVLVLVLLTVLPLLRLVEGILADAIGVHAVLVVVRAVLLSELMLRLLRVHLVMLPLELLLLVGVSGLLGARAARSGLGTTAEHVSLARVALPGRALVAHGERGIHMRRRRVSNKPERDVLAPRGSPRGLVVAVGGGGGAVVRRCGLAARALSLLGR